MTALHDVRCLNHRDREAVARCPSCTNFFCRECVTEHLGRVLCAKCLAAATAHAEERRSTSWLLRPLAAIASFLFICLFFFMIGRSLLMLPDSFHDGAIWSTDGANTGSGR